MTLVTLAELQQRCDWDLDDDEQRIGQAALDDLTEDARYYGGRGWSSPETTPRLVLTTILRAAKRYLGNPDGYEVSRAGDETLDWGAGVEAKAAFSREEQRLLRELGGGAVGLQSVPVVAWGTRLRQGPDAAPVDYGGRPMPGFGAPW